MTQLVPDAGPWWIDRRSRRVTRPAVTSLILAIIGLMILIDVWKRWRTTSSRAITQHAPNQPDRDLQ